MSSRPSSWKALLLTEYTEHMHICLLYPGFPPESHAGGIGTYAFEAAKAFGQAGQRITIVSRSESFSDTKKCLASNVTLYRLGEDSNNNALPFRAGNHQRHYQRIRNLIENIHADNPIDVIESCDWGAEGVALLATPFKHKMVVRCHTPSFIAEQYNSKNTPYLSIDIKKQEKYLLMNAKCVVCPSRSLANMILASLPRTRTIEHEPYLLNTAPISPKHNYSFRDIFSILTVGRIEERKGQDIIIEALGILHRHGMPIHFHALGQDTSSDNGIPMSETFLKIANDASKSRISFHGALPRHSVMRAYHQYDAYIAASRFDNFPFTVLEAMAAGLPVIGNSQAGGIPEQIINRTNGLLFDGTAKDLANKITALFANKELRYTLGTNAKRHVQKTYNPKTVTRQILQNYNALCTTSNT